MFVFYIIIIIQYANLHTTYQVDVFTAHSFVTSLYLCIQCATSVVGNPPLLFP